MLYKACCWGEAMVAHIHKWQKRWAATFTRLLYTEGTTRNSSHGPAQCTGIYLLTSKGMLVITPISDYVWNVLCCKLQQELTSFLHLSIQHSQIKPTWIVGPVGGKKKGKKERKNHLSLKVHQAWLWERTEELLPGEWWEGTAVVESHPQRKTQASWSALAAYECKATKRSASWLSQPTISTLTSLPKASLPPMPAIPVQFLPNTITQEKRKSEPKSWW